MSSEDAIEENRRIMRENHEKRVARVEKAIAEAPANKEPLDVERVKRESRTSVLGVATEEELVFNLQELYYADHPKYRTNRELINLVNLFADYH